MKYHPSSTMITGISLILGLLVLNMLPCFLSLFSFMPLIYVCVYVFFGGFIITDIMIPLTMHLLLTNVFLYNLTKIVMLRKFNIETILLNIIQTIEFKYSWSIVLYGSFRCAAKWFSDICVSIYCIYQIIFHCRL